MSPKFNKLPSMLVVDQILFYVHLVHHQDVLSKLLHTLSLKKKKVIITITLHEDTLDTSSACDPHRSAEKPGTDSRKWV